jgi:hypothetical protein
MLEASEYVTAGRKIVLCIKNVAVGSKIAGHTITPTEAADLNRARGYLVDVAKRHKVEVYETVEKMTEACLKMLDGLKGSREAKEPEG